MRFLRMAHADLFAALAEETALRLRHSIRGTSAGSCATDDQENWNEASSGWKTRLLTEVKLATGLLTCIV
jgi:hypothetical protein